MAGEYRELVTGGPGGPQPTDTWIVWWPRAPSGAGGVIWSVWTAPDPSVARTDMVCGPRPAAAASQA